jgi:hypothetical protein
MIAGKVFAFRQVRAGPNGCLILKVVSAGKCRPFKNSLRGKAGISPVGLKSPDGLVKMRGSLKKRAGSGIDFFVKLSGFVPKSPDRRDRTLAG